MSLLNNAIDSIQVGVEDYLTNDSKRYLSAQYEIERAAQIGGSLLNRFGKSWFPHIKDREIRFALKVDTELENYLYNKILNESF